MRNKNGKTMSKNNTVNKTIMETMMGKDYESFFCTPTPNFDALQEEREPVEESEKRTALDEKQREQSYEHSLT